MIFENSSVDLSKLPPVEKAEVNRLMPNYLKVAYISTILLFLAILGIALGTAFYQQWGVDDIWIYALLSTWLLLLVASLLLVRAEYNIQGYVIREKDILYRSGVIFRSETAVPFNRVQHCEIKQGPIQRLFGLKSLDIFTAGGARSDMSIPGLEAEQAQQLKEFIIKTVGANEELES